VNWLDRWQEIFESLARHPLRTGLTALSVAWGVFMLVVLLGAGSGLENHVRWEFRDDAINSVWIYGGKTARPFDGLAVGRPIRFNNADYERIRDDADGVEYVTGRFRTWGGDAVVAYRDKHAPFNVRAVHPDHRRLENTRVSSGRFLDAFDVTEQRKVTVLGEEVARFLFGDADPIGARIAIGGLSWLVVGVFEDDGGPGETEMLYVPITTAQAAWHGGDTIHQIMFTVGDADVTQSGVITDQISGMLAARHRFDPDDRTALRVRNNLEDFAEVQTIFAWLNGFLWLVGVGTITAGIVGVGNIMLVSVHERTREIGLRKALGATPNAIVAMILEEAVLLTAASGYLGLLSGVALLEIVTRFMPENDYVRDPEVHFGAALFAMGLLVAFGALAGFVPARRAAAVRPIEALRDE
jgi:putative ABC transport system permease protein